MTSELLWISEAPTQVLKRPVFHRRSHKKSRRGCLTCKERRVKCDEAQPVCRNCSSRAATCEYAGRAVAAANGLPSPASSACTPKAVDRRPKHTAPQRTDLMNDTMSDVSLTSEVSLGMGFFASSIANMTRTHAITNTSPNTLSFLLHHFSTTAYATLSSSTGQKIIQQRIPGLIMQFPFLLEAVIAFSASHMSYLKQRSSGVVPSSMGVVAAWHIVRALRGYGQKISDFQSREATSTLAHQQDGLNERKGMDALVAACLILTSLFYHVSWSENQPQLWSSLWLPAGTREPSSGDSTTSDGYTPAYAGNVSVPLPSGVPTPLSNSTTQQANSHTGETTLTSKPQCDWLTNVTGMSIILTLTQFREHLPHSIWYPFLAEGNDTQPTPEALIDSKVRSRSAPTSFDQHIRPNSLSTTQQTPSCNTIHPPLPAAPSSTSHLPSLSHLLALSTHIHRPALRPLLAHLVTLLPLRPSDLSTFSRIISFPSFFPAPTFPQLVAARDPVVLLILGYWFGMLEGVPHWWCRERGRREGRVVERWVCGVARSWEGGVAEDGARIDWEGGLDGLWGLQAGEAGGLDRSGRELAWGYSRIEKADGWGGATGNARWNAAVKMAAEEFVRWRRGRGLRL